MPKKNPKVDAYIAQAAPFARPILRHLRKLVRSATFAELARGESISSTSAGSDSLYVILGGEATMLRPTLLSLRTGDYFGELGVLGGQPYSLFVVAERDLHVMKLPRQPVLELARRHPPVTISLLKELGLRLRPAVAR